MDKNKLKKVGRYVRNTMAPAEREAFREQLRHDEQLARAVAVYEEMIRSVVNRNARGAEHVKTMDELRAELEAFKQSLPDAPDTDSGEEEQ